MLSLRNAWRRWWATVWVLMYMRVATWLLFSPSATRPATACSVPVRLSHPVTVGTNLAVLAKCVFQVTDDLIPVPPASVQDAQVFAGGGPGPGIGVLHGGLGQAVRIAGGQAPAVGRGGGQGRE